MPASTIRPRMTPRRPAIAATSPLLVLGLALGFAACQTTGPSIAATTPLASTAPTPTPVTTPSFAAASPTPTPVSGTAACDPLSLSSCVAVMTQ